MSTNPYAVPPFEQHQAPEPYVQPKQTSRAVPRVISALGGVLLTPVALGLVIYAGSRLQRMFAQAYTVGDDLLGLFLLLLGGVLLLGVALLGALSGLGPVIGGLMWGVLPGLTVFLSPRDFLGLMYDVGGRELGVGVVTWMVMGALMGSGFLLIGAGLVGTLARRRSNRV
ncbi:hypothetical protein [Amycolatopsis pittospori]|uniref:hypothetical protein n=1 Tax=Amycolatopsis pittospori TaxID=2749434 RepID=UPI001F1D10B9|nr:hypothetical protein [Amycolatopsis pittospori]